MTATKSGAPANIYDELFKNIKTATETNLKLQQEVLKQWGALWPGVPSPETDWVEKVRDFQSRWVSTVTDLTKQHREMVDKQFDVAIDSLEDALKVAESSSPEEFRQRAEQLCRKSIDTLREVSESQVTELQDLMKKWSELVTKIGT